MEQRESGIYAPPQPKQGTLWTPEEDLEQRLDQAGVKKEEPKPVPIKLNRAQRRRFFKPWREKLVRVRGGPPKKEKRRGSK